MRNGTDSITWSKLGCTSFVLGPAESDPDERLVENGKAMVETADVALIKGKTIYRIEEEAAHPKQPRTFKSQNFV